MQLSDIDYAEAVLAEAIMQTESALEAHARVTPHDHGSAAQLHMRAFALQCLLSRADTGEVPAWAHTANTRGMSIDQMVGIAIDAAIEQAIHEDEVFAESRADWLESRLDETAKTVNLEVDDD